MMLGEAIRDFWFLHSDLVLGRIYWVLWTFLVGFVVRLWDGHFMWRRIEAKMPPYVMQEIETLKLANAEKDRTIERQAELIQKLAVDRRSAEALGKAIVNAIGAGPG